MSNDNWMVELRERASTKLRDDLSSLPAVQVGNHSEIVEELHTYQIELEMQNQDLLETQEELIRTRDLYRAYLNFAPVGLVTLSHKGRIIDINRALTDIWGTEREVALGTQISDRVWVEDRDVLYLHCRRAFETTLRQTCQLRMIGRDEQPFWAELNTGRLEVPGSAENWLCIAISDINDRHRAESEMRSAREEAELVSQSKSEFITRMGRELRTPLNTILALVSDPESTLLGHKQGGVGEVADQTFGAGQHLLTLIDEMSDPHQKDVDAAPLPMTTVDLGGLLEGCTLFTEPLRQKYAVSLEYPVALHSAPPVRANAARLKQVLLSLVTNAIILNREQGRLVVSWKQSGARRLRLAVTDSSAGMSVEQVRSLFEHTAPLSSERAGGPHDRSTMGLASARRWVRSMDGDLGVESTLGIGNTFWLDLGLAATPSAQAPVAADHGLDPAGISTLRESPHKVLCIEDDPSQMMLMLQVLERRRPGAVIVKAMTAETGIELASSEQPDVILSDIGLPGMSGLDALAVLKTRANTKSIPVIAVSAELVSKELHLVRQVGFQDFITKPIDFELLDQAIDRALGSKNDSPKRTYRVLVVDDNRNITDMLSRRLTQAGFEVMVAADGEGAVKTAIAERPDMILMDLGLPIKDGYTAAREIRMHPATQSVAIIAVTAYEAVTSRERALAAGCDRFLNKPVSFAALLENIEDLLGSRS